jgi:hypothetical protein
MTLGGTGLKMALTGSQVLEAILPSSAQGRTGPL